MSATPSKRPRAASHEAVLDSPLKNGQRPASPSAQAPPAATSKAAAAAPPPPSAAEPPSAASFDSSSSRTHAERSIGASSGAPAVERREEPKSEDEEEEVEEEQPYDDTADQATRTDMYLDTINRDLLDFDFEKVCSVSLSNTNVYCCLVDGKYFQGRGKNSWAYKHSVSEGKHVFLKLDTEEFFILPDGYKVSDPSLQDIIRVLAPRYTKQQIAALSYLPKTPSYDLHGRPYVPGYIGLNNIKFNDYQNVIILSLLHVPPIRDFLLAPENPLLQAERKPTELVKRFAALARKVWNPHLFKAQVSPHEFLQEVTVASGGKFQMTKQGDPLEFLGWLLNRLHRDLGGNKKAGSSIIHKAFQGDLRIETQQYVVKADSGGNKRPQFDVDRETKTARSPFLFLALDLPKPPLFQDSVEKNIIPQVALATILAKYDGKTTHEFGDTLKRHKLERLPPYLILHTKRFTKNNFVEEKNPTIVNFPLRGVDMGDYVDPRPSDPIESVYDLLANMPYESSAASTTTQTGSATATNPKKKVKVDEADRAKWKVHLRAGGGGGEGEKWFAIQDLRVDEVQKEMVFLGETVLQIWQRRDLGPRGDGPQ